jgi:hypothetical protein
VKWPPGKETGALLHAPISEKLGRAQYKSAKVSAQPCSHPVTRTERFPGGQPHYAHEVCATCGRHVRWFPKPATSERRRLNAFRLARLGMCSTLSPWERHFVRSVSQRKKLSRRQQAVLDRLVTQYLEGAP